MEEGKMKKGGRNAEYQIPAEQRPPDPPPMKPADFSEAEASAEARRLLDAAQRGEAEEVAAPASLDLFDAKVLAYADAHPEGISLTDAILSTGLPLDRITQGHRTQAWMVLARAGFARFHAAASVDGDRWVYARPADRRRPTPHDMPPDLTGREGAKDTNPKDGIGATKLPLSLVPATAIDVESLAFLNGALKYGRANWRACGVRASIYVDACRRHLSAWENGEECDAEGVPHLGAARACLGIIIDAEACGKLNDDRPPSVDLTAYRARLTPIVASLTALHADRHPRHFSIADTKGEG